MGDCCVKIDVRNKVKAVRALIEKVKDFYRDFSGADLTELDTLYTVDASFRDPLHSISGVREIARYFEAGRRGLLSCSFDYSNEIVSSQSFVLEWDMYFAHRKLNGGRQIAVPGCSVFELDESECKVIKHVDYYDLGSLVYEQVPILGGLIGQIKKRVASQ